MTRHTGRSSESPQTDPDRALAELPEDVRRRLEAAGFAVSHDGTHYQWDNFFGDRRALIQDLEEAERDAEREALDTVERDLAARYSERVGPTPIPAAQAAHRQERYEQRRQTSATTDTAPESTAQAGRHARESRPAAPRVHGSRRGSRSASSSSDDPSPGDEPPPRRCLCGCGASLAGRARQARYVDDTHRKRAARRGAGDPLSTFRALEPVDRHELAESLELDLDGEALLLLVVAPDLQAVAA